MPAPFRRDLAFADGDAVYQNPIDALAGLDVVEARKIIAKLILLRANRVGDEAVFAAAIAGANQKPGSA